MAFTMFCGFMHDLPTPLVGAGASIVSSPRHYEAPSLKITYNGANAAYFRLQAPDSTGKFTYYGTTSVHVAGYLQVSEWGACEVMVVTEYLTDTAIASLRLKANGTLELRNSVGTVLATGQTPLAVGTWYHVQLTVNWGVTGAYSFSIDRTAEFSGTANFGTTEIGEARFGTVNVTGSDALTYYWAEVSANDTGALATGQRVLIYNIDGDGYWTEFTGGYANVNEDPSDGDTTTITSSTTGNRFTGTVDGLALPAGVNVYSVLVRAISKAASSTHELRYMMRSGTTDVQTSPHVGITTAWTQGGAIRLVDPATSLPWTETGIASAQPGVRRASGSVGASLVTSIWMEVLVAADDLILPPQTGKTVLAFMSDLHAGGTAAYIAHVLSCIHWIQSQGCTIGALCVAGDLCENDAEVPPFHEWIRDPDYGNLDESIELVVAPGNWDFDDTPASGVHEAIAENPLSGFKAIYTEYGDKEYVCRDIGSVRIAGLNNVSDYLNGSGDSMYFNCNPPGYEHVVNPDHSGILTPGSELRVWMDSLFGYMAPRWRITMAHRSHWAPFDSDPRKLNRDGRVAYKVPIDRGLSIVFTGDIHVGSLSGPWYPFGGPIDATARYVPPGTGAGAYSLTLAGGYLPRDVETDILPDHATTCAWASGVDGSKMSQAAIIAFDDYGDTARIVIFEASDLDPVGSVVYDGILYRNTNYGPQDDNPSVPVACLKKGLKAVGGVMNDHCFPPTLYRVLYDAILELRALRTAFNAHTHGCDGGQAADYTSSTPGLDVKTVGVESPTVVATVAQRVDIE